MMISALHNLLLEVLDRPLDRNFSLVFSLYWQIDYLAESFSSLKFSIPIFIFIYLIFSCSRIGIIDGVMAAAMTISPIWIRKYVIVPAGTFFYFDGSYIICLKFHFQMLVIILVPFE